MGQKAEIIAKLIEEAAPKTAVVFSGSTPRLIGTLDAVPINALAARHVVDPMLFSQRLSVTYISIGECGGKRFVAAFG